MRTRTWVIAAVLAALVGPLSGCSATSPELKLLRADPMATATPEGLTSQSVAEEAGGSTFGMPTPAEVVRYLHLRDPAAAMVELDQAARDSGWETRHPLDLAADPVVVVYERTSDGQLLDLDISWDGTDKVFLSLTALRGVGPRPGAT